MNLLGAALHHIDVINNNVQQKEVDRDDALEYVRLISKEVSESANKRDYTIIDNEYQVVKIVSESCQTRGLTSEGTNSIARRLLDKEIITQNQISRLGKVIKKGSLIQAIYETEENLYYLISKVESTNFLDTSDLVKKVGLPFDKKLIKNSLFKFDLEAEECINIFLSDNYKKISSYWSNDFLELNEKTSDLLNTEKVYDIIDGQLKRRLKKKDISKYTLARNQLLGYFKNTPSFRLTECLDYIFGENENIDSSTTELKGNIQQFTATKITEFSLDSEFTISANSINKRRLKEKMIVNPLIEITLNGETEDLKNMIISKEDEEGNRIIQITVTEPETFNAFNWNLTEE